MWLILDQEKQFKFTNGALHYHILRIALLWEYFKVSELSVELQYCNNTVLTGRQQGKIKISHNKRSFYYHLYYELHSQVITVGF